MYDDGYLVFFSVSVSHDFVAGTGEVLTVLAPIYVYCYSAYT